MNALVKITTGQRAVARGEGSTGAARVLEVLRHVAERPQGYRLGEIAAEMQAPKSSVHRALSALIAAGLVRQSSDGTYHLGYDFLRLAFRYHEEFAPHLAVAPVLQRLAEEIGETTHYGVLLGPDIVYQAKVAPSRPAFQMSSVVGGSNPAYRTGVGKALLMHHLTDPSEVAEFVAKHGPFERRTPTTLCTAEDLYAALEEGRARGYTLDLEENEVGIGCLAVPLFLDSAVMPTGAISISAVTSRTTVADLVARLDDVCGIITDELGDVLGSTQTPAGGRASTPQPAVSTPRPTEGMNT